MKSFCRLCLRYKLIFKSPQVNVGEVGCHSGPRCCSLDLDVKFTIEGEITEYKPFIKKAWQSFRPWFALVCFVQFFLNNNESFVNVYIG